MILAQKSEIEYKNLEEEEANRLNDIRQLLDRAGFKRVDHNEAERVVGRETEPVVLIGANPFKRNLGFYLAHEEGSFNRVDRSEVDRFRKTEDSNRFVLTDVHLYTNPSGSRLSSGNAVASNVRVYSNIPPDLGDLRFNVVNGSGGSLTEDQLAETRPALEQAIRDTVLKMTEKKMNGVPIDIWRIFNGKGYNFGGMQPDKRVYHKHRVHHMLTGNEATEFIQRYDIIMD